MISIICPLYNAEKYIENLHTNLLNQELETNFKIDINYVLTESKDKTEVILNNIGAKYIKIKTSDFSHSTTRENMARKVKGDIIIFISQDIIMKNKFWLKNLVQPILKGQCEASFSRQICENKTIEKYIREKNYPNEDRIVDKSSLEKYGLMTFFYSDASSAVKKDIYLKLNGYDNKNLIINEDMYFAHKLIEGNYRIKYCSKSEVYHSHTFKLSQLAARYFDTGVFFKENSQFLNYNGNKNGKELAVYVFRRAVQEKNVNVLFNILPNFGARYIGSLLGKMHEKLPLKLVKKISSNKIYWE